MTMMETTKNSNTKETTLPKTFMHSFTMPGGARSFKALQKACEMRKEELINEAIKQNQVNEQSRRKDKELTGGRFVEKVNVFCTFSYEIMEGMDNVRANLYGATIKDAVAIGYNYAVLEMNPSWI